MFFRPPAWSEQFSANALRKVRLPYPFDRMTQEWAWGEATGAGIKVAVLDSGIDADHEAIAGQVSGYVAIHEGAAGIEYNEDPHGDTYGHGTACAGIIRSIAPRCELYSVKVLGNDLSGRGVTFAAGIRWAIDHGMHVCNLSLGTTKKDFYGALHELADLAYFRNVMLVAAANNLSVISYPSMYASVISVASYPGKDPFRFYYNPQPPVEFGAPGINVRVAWKNGKWSTVTGNSFAAPHIAGIIARILSKHPALTAFQIKAVLCALAANMSSETQGQALGKKEDE